MKRLFIVTIMMLTCLICFADNDLSSIGDASEQLISDEQKTDGIGLITKVQDLTYEIKNSKIGKVSDIFVSITTLIICIGAICLISTKVIQAALKGEVIKIEILLKPFIFAIIIASYQPIIQGVDWIVNSLDGLVVTLSYNSIQEIENKREEKAKLIEKIENKLEDDASIWDSVGAALNKFKSWIVYYTIQFIAYTATFLVKITGTILAITFYVFGPITIALSVIPAFSDSWKNWLAKYIWALLFTPMCRIIAWILQEIELVVLDKDIARLQYCLEHFEETKGGLSITGGSFMEGVAYLGFMLAGAIMYLCVPAISSWIVNTTGGGVMTGMNAGATIAVSKGSQASKWTAKQGWNGGNAVINKIKSLKDKI